VMHLDAPISGGLLVAGNHYSCLNNRVICSFLWFWEIVKQRAAVGINLWKKREPIIVNTSTWVAVDILPKYPTNRRP
jgi:hypothetical protein